MEDTQENNTAGIIPKPASLRFEKGSFKCGNDTPITWSPGKSELESAARIFTDEIRKYTKINCELNESSGKGNGIHLELLENDSMTEEDYHLKITRHQILLTSTSCHGIWDGLQTLKQLILEASPENGTVEIPCMEIKDHPRFGWRGMHLDVSRHFYPVDSIKRYIDYLALYKYNRFHWHLTDDQGWRIEIRKYPELTRKGAWRKTEHVGSEGTEDSGSGPYGGYYTQEEISEIVDYAAHRYIEVIPEIEMPGHSQAAIAAYPELGVTGKQLEVMTRWGISPNIYNPSDESLAFLKDVLEEVIGLFPSKFIHIGGDEAIKDQWEESREVQSRIRELGLANEDELQSWFIAQIEAFLSMKGRRIIGWDEILEGGIPGRAVVMSWRGVKGGLEAAREGHDVIMTPNTHCYLNFSQAENEPTSWARRHVTKLEKVYSYDPVPQDLDKSLSHHILGGQGCIWTEHLPTFRSVEKKLFPRIAALAEVLWTDPTFRDPDDFRLRLQVQIPLFEKMEINYYKGEFEPVKKKPM